MSAPHADRNRSECPESTPSRPGEPLTGAGTGEDPRDAEIARLSAEMERLRISPDTIEELLGIDPNDPLNKLARYAVDLRAELAKERAKVARVEALTDECAESGCIHLNTMWGRLRAALTGPTDTGDGPA